MADFDIYQQQLAQQQRRQQYAQMLMQQGLQQEPTQMAGNVAVRQNPLSGLARALAAYKGAQGVNEADTQMSNILQQKDAADKESIAKGMQLFNAGDKQGAMQAFSASPKGQAYAAELMKSQLAPSPADQRTFEWLQTQSPEVQEAYAKYKQVAQKPETPYFTTQPTSTGIMIFNNRTGKYEMATDSTTGTGLPQGGMPPGPMPTMQNPMQPIGQPNIGAMPPANRSRLLPVAADPGIQGAVAQSTAVGKGTGEAQVAPIKALAEKSAEKQVAAQFDAPGALTLMGDWEKVILRQPSNAIMRGVQGVAGYAGMGNEDQQNAVAEGETIASELMKYAEKLPGPASDKDRVDFKASIGNYASPGATKAQRLAAMRQARKSFERLIQKYGSGVAPGAQAAPAGQPQRLRFNPATGELE